MECKNRRIGAAAIINALKHPKKKNEKQSEKKKALNEGREGSNPLIWSPTDAVNSKLLKHPSTHSPTQKKKKKIEQNTKTGKRGLEPAHLASYCCKQYIINRTVAVHVVQL